MYNEVAFGFAAVMMIHQGWDRDGRGTGWWIDLLTTGLFGFYFPIMFFLRFSFS
jgi:hypothetical protein